VDAAEGAHAQDDSRGIEQTETETEEDNMELEEAFEKAMPAYIQRKVAKKGRALIGAGKEVNGMGECGLLQRPLVHDE
jgi:hypothetical protein